MSNLSRQSQHPASHLMVQHSQELLDTRVSLPPCVERRTFKTPQHKIREWMHTLVMSLLPGVTDRQPSLWCPDLPSSTQSHPCASLTLVIFQISHSRVSVMHLTCTIPLLDLPPSTHFIPVHRMFLMLHS